MTKIYLISPPNLEVKTFCNSLKNALQTNLIPVFQLRLKGYEEIEIEKIARELQKICQDHNCQFIINDNFKIAQNIGANGVHLGAEDGSIMIARKKSPKNFIIGASCYDSRHLACEAVEQGADYLSFGTFFPSTTKNSKGKPTTEILEWCSEMTDLPVVAIGGINAENCAPLIQAGTDFLAVISYIWQHPKGEAEAVKSLNQAIISASSNHHF